MADNPNNQRIFTLNEVLNSVQKTIANRYQSAYWMKAEMNKLNFYSYSGHCYPDLVEKSEGKVIAQARSIIWNSDFQFINKKFLEVLKEPLKDGITILFLARITFTPQYGLSLQIIDIDPSYSLGVLEKEKQENIEQLKKEGLFNKNKKLTFPVLPKRIAIVSVETSKGFVDFIKVLKKKKEYAFAGRLFPARLQGEFAITDISKQLKAIKKVIDSFDVVAIIRGGGGDVGLSAFNDLGLSKEVANFPIPVITGIGHATNETIVEMVAFKNAITPTACAQFLVEKFQVFDMAIRQFQKNLVHQSQMLLAAQKEKQNLILQLFHKSVQQIFKGEKQHIQQKLSLLTERSSYLVKMEEQTLENISKQFKNSSVSLLKSQDEKIKQLQKQLNLVHPDNVLKRGYSITKHNGKVIDLNKEIPEEGQEIETVFINGSLISIVKHKK